MGSVIPWGKKNKEEQANEITIHHGNPLSSRNKTGAVIQVYDRELMIAGRKVKIDPYQLIRIIKRVTQNIGEYKGHEDLYSTVIVGALRKARGDLVNILENEFHVHWQIDQSTGESIFFL